MHTVKPHTMERSARLGVPPTSSRPVRTERWQSRAFFAFPCAFLLDVPLDMTGVIQAALRAAVRAGVTPIVEGDVLVTDAIHRGAVLVEIVDDGQATNGILRFDGGELLGRELPPKPTLLRAEIEELVRWSREIDQDVAAVYVRYSAHKNDCARPISIHAALR